MKKKILITAGGTGGHLFPAQALAQKLKQSEQVHFAAFGLAKSRYFDREQFSFDEILSATFSLKHPFKALVAMGTLLKGVMQARRLLRNFRPDLVVGFGSFFTLPILIAAKLQNIPIVLHEQNAIPGKVNRLFSRFAKLTTITFPHSAPFLKKKSLLVSFPIRTPIEKEKIDPWNYFGLESGKKVLLIFGGSQGASRLNTLAVEAVLQLKAEVQVIHLTGNKESVLAITQKYADHNIKACVKEFEKRMDLAWQIASCALCRAGAGTIVELIETQTPAILIPFPFATDNHQWKNGCYFVEEVGGGRLLDEATTTGDLLAAVIDQVIEMELVRLKKLIQSHKNRQKLHTLDEIILQIVRPHVS